MDELVSTDWLAEHLDEVRIVDASFHLPSSERDARDEYAKAHIPGAVFLDIERVADSAHPAPHMLPRPHRFAEEMRQLGIGQDDCIVVYDNSPFHSAARGWFMLSHFGATNVAILDGGMQKWLAEGRPTSSDAPEPDDVVFNAAEGEMKVTDKQAILSGETPPVLDARGPDRFAGTTPEPREGLEAGHIPGAKNLHYARLYNDDGTFKSKAELAAAFDEAGLDPSQPFVASCGSGVTACALIFAARQLGHDSGVLYDGSWAEWGADPETPKERA